MALLGTAGKHGKVEQKSLELGSEVGIIEQEVLMHCRLRHGPSKIPKHAMRLPGFVNKSLNDTMVFLSCVMG